MKKLLAFLLATAMVTVVGCTSEPAPTESSTPSGETSQADSTAPAAGGDTVDADLILATGGTSGTYYPFGGAIAATMNTGTGSNITAQATGASVENVRLLQSGDADLGIVQTDILSYAIEGINNFAETGVVDNVYAVASLYPEVVHLVTTDMSINSIADLEGKAVSVGAAGSGTEINARQFLEAYGIDYEMIDERFLSFAESGTALQDGSISAAFIVAGVPNSAITELSVSKPVKLISLGDAERAAIIEKYPFYAEHTVPAGTYQGMEEDGSTLAVKAVLIARAELSEDDVYYLTKALFENLDSLGQAHAKGLEVSLEDAMQGIVPGNVHPGAAKYFTEMGIEVPQ